MKTKLIIIFLLIGCFYKLLLTSDGYFIFNIDNARDFLDVREMVELKKLRLIGPTSGIEGFFNGPAWYYLLAIPYIFSAGNPYSGVVLMILFWALGGFFLLKISSRWGLRVTIAVALVWLSSNLITLSTFYSFNPNPVILLMPVFIYFLERYLTTGKLTYSLISFGLGGLFFNFEMAAGVFIPPIFLISSYLIDKRLILKKEFVLGSMFFVLFLLPQILFDLKHNFLMSSSILKYIGSGEQYYLTTRLLGIMNAYYQMFYGVFLNHKLTTLVAIFFSLLALRSKERVVRIILVVIIIPLVGYGSLPIKAMPWHIGASASAFILLFGYGISRLKVPPVFSALFVIFVVIIAINNLEFERFISKEISDPSVFRNQLKAIDYVYNQAQGKDFKVYTYLPSVYDYPYQYLFWWYGKRQYGYLPQDFAYLPNKFEYIKNKDFFLDNIELEDSKLVFLIKENDYPDRLGAWEDNFKNLEVIKIEKVGPLEIETRRDIK